MAIHGVVVEVEFPTSKLPATQNALRVEWPGRKSLILDQARLGDGWVQCLALTSTNGLNRRVSVADTVRPTNGTNSG